MSEVLISELLADARKPLLSLEFFPPADHRGFAFLGSTIERLRLVRPDFVTVTYGAGGSTRARTLVVSEVLRGMGFGPVVVHLTCVGADRSEVEAIADDIHARGFRNIMALRGDPPEGQADFQPVAGGLSHASELVGLLKERHADFCIGVGGYPETHPEATSPEEDIRHLKEKVDAGASFVTAQLFYENEAYFEFVERCRAAGITAPIIPGLLPAVSLKQVDRVVALCGASFPEELANAMGQVGGKGPVAEAIGMDWAVRQIDELLERGAPGVHLYILNRARTALLPGLDECLNRWRG